MSSGNYKDLTGVRSGRLVALERIGSKNNRAIWRCRCDCGNETVIESSRLINGRALSCGCIRRENIIEMNSKVKKCDGIAPSRSRLYKEWRYIQSRCLNPNNSSYRNYGGRGIKVCDEWLKFEPFRDWALANGYRDDLTIDRIDVDGNYEPLNCRWATKREQANNRRTNVLLTYRGETHNITEWSNITGIRRSTLYSRIYRGWPLELVLTVGSLSDMP